MSTNTQPDIISNVEYADPTQTVFGFDGPRLQPTFDSPVLRPQTVNTPTQVITETTPAQHAVVTDESNQPFKTTDYYNQNAPTNKATEFHTQIANAAVPETKPISDDVVQLGFDFLKEANLFVIPEGVSINAENYEQVVDYNRSLNIQNAYEYIRSLAGDESVAQLFDLVIEGGTFDDLEKGKDIISEEAYLSNLDVTNVEHQRILITEYYKDGLDASKPAHLKRLENVPNEVASIIDAYKGEETAKEALKFFMNEIAGEKEQIKNEIKARKEQEAYNLQVQRQQEALWRKNFVTTLEQRAWSSAKKDSVINQFDTLEFDNGTEMPLWKYKLQMIQSSPEQSHVLMDFLADYDHSTRTFKTKNMTVTQESTNAIKKLIQNKSINKTGLGGNNSESSQVEFARPVY